MTTTIPTATIPANEHGTGFVAVAVRFPADPAAHRATVLFHQPEGTTGGMPIRFDGKDPFTTEVRPACQPDSDPDHRYYRLSVPFALARGARACNRPECYGQPG